MSAPSPGEQRAGFAAAAIAYLSWGFLPLFLHLLAFADPFEVLGHRVLWCIPAALVAVLAVSGWRRGLAEIRGALAPRMLWRLVLSAGFIFFNWGLYVWAVAKHEVASAALAYFLTPLVQIAFGVAFFQERVTGAQKAALAIAAAGVILQGIAMGAPPWISLALCFTWSCYGLVRKQVEVSAASGLLLESVLVAPLAVALLAWTAHGPGLTFAASPLNALLLALTGPITAVPLILFAYGARRLTFTALGPMQFATPSVQFLLAVAFGEAVTPLRLASFALIWVALAIFMYDAIAREQARRRLVGAG